MTLTQISIFIENRKGRLSCVANVLAAAKINILALSLADTSDFGILRIVVSDPVRACEILRANQLICRTNPVVAIEVPDESGSLAMILDSLSDLSIEYMYAMRQPSGKNALIFRFDDFETVPEKLKDKPLRFITDSDLLS